MNLRNYTSKVSTERSTTAIERLLADAGVTHIMRTYADKRLTGFVFSLVVSGRSITFKLPANPAAVKNILAKEMKRPRPETLKRLQDQSERTAWKLLHEWVAIQISLIQMGQADAVQVFLPYAYDSLKNETIYERFKANGFKALTAGKEESK